MSFCGTHKFITVFTRVRHLCPSWARLIQSTLAHFVAVSSYNNFIIFKNHTETVCCCCLLSACDRPISTTVRGSHHLYNSEPYPVYAHQTAVCRNPPIQFSEQTEKTWQILERRTSKHVTFLQKYKEKQLLLWPRHLDGRCVCNPTVW